MIFGIAGKLESGKTTVANRLMEKYGYKELAFADNLKQMCVSVFNLTLEQCYTTKGKLTDFPEPILFEQHHAVGILKWVLEINDWPVTTDNNWFLDDIIKRQIRFTNPRHVLQFIGTEVCRDCFDDAFHAKNLFKDIERRGWKNAVVSDARFANERQMIKDNGGMNILVDCVQTRAQKSTHKSENDLGSPEDYDFIIVNDKEYGFIPLHKDVDRMIRQINENTI